MARPQGRLMDPIRSPSAAASSFHRSAAKHFQQAVTLAQRNGISRRCLLTLLTSTAAIPDGSESRKALLQEYLKKSKDNKEKNDKEKLKLASSSTPSMAMASASSSAQPSPHHPPPLAWQWQISSGWGGPCHPPPCACGSLSPSAPRSSCEGGHGRGGTARRAERAGERRFGSLVGEEARVGRGCSQHR
ncbi:uncharacterized protein LOC120688308 isoform X1 [Panicum virgatum]|uniref:uncharacterized protein LOC120688308 isoform X1 n=1 Tax=Panicum virgatum TaxID=38727 RepID=UPI0019D67F31|nr:uncharacterized protein LOC120688308 isoform X1 [Panicum virgatum]